MARKTKQVLEKEVMSLMCQVEDLYKEIRELNIEKDYWFVKSERYRVLYSKENLKNYEIFEPDTKKIKQLEEKEMEELEKMEQQIAATIEGIKRFDMKQSILHSCYGANY
ncbi:hypothetical protein AB1I92_06215 [Bacillus mobilis]|uniref:hypothetical protein n=1 Tax=Bacillus cereus group TaxID=86661 RepID=UPI0029C2012E|nr:MULTISPECIES: hypothetical protein [unclassified Bacillus cereus group]MDX5819870.1 hypothetical protein [Bacillus cereus group sp. BfR-BA-02490]MDX5881794.1 hypothetical protein [Bacillus cereus group sp. BfR-BA-00999]HDR4581916.1 hypothetical protein [Bacillus cereus]HDR4585070.1 hypothetical protein [Bacillus cereus]